MKIKRIYQISRANLNCSCVSERWFEKQPLNTENIHPPINEKQSVVGISIHIREKWNRNVLLQRFVQCQVLFFFCCLFFCNAAYWIIDCKWPAITQSRVILSKKLVLNWEIQTGKTHCSNQSGSLVMIALAYATAHMSQILIERGERSFSKQELQAF